ERARVVDECPAELEERLEAGRDGLNSEEQIVSGVGGPALGMQPRGPAAPVDTAGPEQEGGVRVDLPAGAGVLREEKVSARVELEVPLQRYPHLPAEGPRVVLE